MSKPDWAAIKKRSRENRAKQLAAQLEKQRERETESTSRADRWLSAARRFKAKHGRWPSPAELRNSGLM